VALFMTPGRAAHIGVRERGDEMKVTLDRTDDLTHERVFDVFFADMKKRGQPFTMPTDPLDDPELVLLLTKQFDPGLPTIMPPAYGLSVA
jgi:hypothetical protein